MNMWIQVIALLARIAGAYIVGNVHNIALNSAMSRPNAVHRRFSAAEISKEQPFTLMTLPYALNALEPHISEETIRYHYLKHHAGYVKKLNELAVKQPEIATKTLDELLETAQGTVYNMAAQVWNHDFYWLGMSPNGSTADAPMTNELINKTFGSHEALKQQITQMATAHFGSGWIWATYDRVNDTLKLAATKDADNPIRLWMAKPVLVLDVWEHAYYIDYRNDKSKYTDAWFKVINWERAEQLIQKYRSE